MRHSARFVIALLGALAIGNAAQASDPPAIRWQREVPGMVLSMVTDNDGNVYVTGQEWDMEAGQFDDPYLVKFDRSGNTLWTRWFPEPSSFPDNHQVLRVNQHGVWVVATWGAGIRLVSHDGHSVKEFDGTNLLCSNTWGPSLGFDSQGRMWIGPSQLATPTTIGSEARVGCFGPNGLEWISTSLGHTASALYQWTMIGDTLYGVYSAGPDQYGPLRLYKLNSSGVATSFPLNVYPANYARQDPNTPIKSRAPTPDGNLLFDMLKVNENRHFLVKVALSGEVLWMKEVPQSIGFSSGWSVVAPSGKIWVPTNDSPSEIKWYDQSGAPLGVSGLMQGDLNLLQFEPDVPADSAILTSVSFDSEKFTPKVAKHDGSNEVWTLSLPVGHSWRQLFGADNDILVHVDETHHDSYLTDVVFCLAQTPEPVPDSPARVALGPQAYRAQSVLDNDRYTRFGSATIARYPAKANLWLRPDGTFLYSPWAGTQNTTDTFEYFPVNGGAKGPATTVTVKVGTVVRGTVTALKPSVGAILGGRSVDGRVELESPAPAGGMAVALVSRNAAVLRVPDVVVVPAGRRSASFTLTPIPVAAETTVEFFAERTSSRVTASLTVRPPQLDSLASATTHLAGTETVTATVKLTGKAPKGGSLVALRSSNPKVKVPESVRVPEGFGTARFKVRLLGVSAPGTARVVASFGSRTRALDLTLSP